MLNLTENIYKLVGQLDKDTTLIVGVTDGKTADTIGIGFLDMQIEMMAHILGDVAGSVARQGVEEGEDVEQEFARIIAQIMVGATKIFERAQEALEANETNEA